MAIHVWPGQPENSPYRCIKNIPKIYQNFTHVTQMILEVTQREFHKTKFRMAYFLPSGKAHDTVIPSLPRVRSSFYYSITFGRLGLTAS
jgi:hypothetical protein